MELVKETKREERKRNVIIKGIKTRKEGMEELKENVEEIVKLTRAVAKVEGIKKIGKKDKDGREMVWVRFANVEKKLKVMKGMMKLKNKKE